MMTSSSITVVIATRNRAHLIADAVTSVTRQQRVKPADVIVVDNGSTDNTPAVIEQIVDGNPLVRTILETRVGLAVARNRGLAATHTDFVAFIDDDIRASPEWVLALNNAFMACRAEAVGGPIHVETQVAEPSWMLPEFRVYFAGCNYGDVGRALQPPEMPVGGNMAFQVRALRDIGGFDESLGYRGRSLIGSEEVELFARIARAGGTIWYSPDAVVTHQVDRLRCTLRWMIRRTFSEGRGRAIVDRRLGGNAFAPPLKSGLANAFLLRKRGAARAAFSNRSTDPLAVELLRSSYFAGTAAGRVATKRLPLRSPVPTWHPRSGPSDHRED